jgi:hypothetical protein
MGRPSGLPGILGVAVDGETFEDCPALDIGYIREPDRIRIRFLTARSAVEDTPDARDPDGEPEPGQERSADPVAAAITVREVADAWQRITRWLRRNAPGSCAALRPGARPVALAALEEELGVPLPLELSALVDTGRRPVETPGSR